jgi:hypothetical protein
VAKPQRGVRGGEIVAEGTPEEVAPTRVFTANPDRGREFGIGLEWVDLLIGSPDYLGSQHVRPQELLFTIARAGNCQ